MDDSHDSGPDAVPPANAAPLEDQPTVISKPGEVPQLISARPTDLARGLEGTRLGHFRLEEFVGGGGMGAVFRAVDLELSRTVAVKVVPCDETDEETLRRFKNEAQSAARLDHGRIARVFYVGMDKGWHYIVFEFVEGVNVRDLVEHKGPLSLEEAIQYTRQVAEALDHAWRREVVHRDVKPSNVLVMQDGSVKVVDMGLARLHQVESSSQDLTESGVTLGTFDYISPEQARDPREADVRSDLYSLGCTLMFMLTGQPPFPDGTVLQKLLRHSSEQPPRVSDRREGVPESLVEVVEKLLAKQPAARYQTPAELVAALDAVAAEAGVAIDPTTIQLPRPADTTTESAWVRHVGWAVPLAALVLIGWALDWPDSSAPPAPPQPKLEAAVPIAPPPAAADDAAEAPPAAAAQVIPNESEIAASSASYADERMEAGPPLVEEEVSAVVATLDPHRIIVSPPDQPPTPGVAHAATLQEAMDKVAASAELHTIELQFDGDLDARPLRATVDRPLVIQAAAGFSPRLLFTPGPADGEGRRMFSLQGGDLTIRSVQMLLRLPDTTTIGTWSLFHLQRDAKLELADCVLTLDDRDYDQLSSFLEVEPRSPTEMPVVGAEPVSDWQRSTIVLNNCIARGATSLVRCDGAPFLCSWTNGLLAISGNVVEARGAAQKHPKPKTMRTELTNVTIYTEKGGLGELDLQNGRHPLRLSFSLMNCAMTNVLSSELIALVGAADADMAEQWTSLTGNNNLLPDDLLVQKTTTRQQEIVSTKLPPNVLFVEAEPRWTRLPPDLLLSEREPWQFELQYEANGSAMPGCPVSALQSLLGPAP